MKQFAYLITTDSPLAIGGQRAAGNFKESVDFIPGASIRGAVAEELLHGCGHPEHLKDHGLCPEKGNCKFYRLFYEGEPIYFGNGLPVGKGDKNGITGLLPATAVSCKAAPGFSTGSSHHGVFDTVAYWLCQERAARELGRFPAVLYSPKCPVCRNRVERFSGPYEYVEGAFHRPNVPKRALTRVALNRRRGTAEDGALYSIDAVEENVTFLLTTTVPDNKAELFEKVMTRVIWHLGGGSSRGLGKVKIKPITQPVRDSTRERIMKFNDRLRQLWGLYELVDHCKPFEVGEGYFTITLRSDGVFYDSLAQPSQILTVEILLDAVKKLNFANLPETRLARSFASNHVRTGWSAATGLPKRVLPAVAAGSVFAFWTKDYHAWFEPLSVLEARGLGELREEGFGSISVCDEFHLCTEGDKA